MSYIYALMDKFLARSLNTAEAAVIVADLGGSPSRATATLSLETKPIATDTITVGDRTYTFQSTLTNVDGNVFIGATVATAQANLYAALNLSGTAGTDYALATTKNTEVDMGPFAADEAVFTAKIAGSAGNALDSTNDFTDASDGFTAVLFTGGDDPAIAADSVILPATYADDAAAAVAGVPVGGIYRVAAGDLAWRQV